MYIQVVREDFGEKATEGKLFINGRFECYTLEDKDRGLEKGGKKVYGETAIPRGAYELKLTHSNRFNKILPLLENVPGFTGIRIHAGNFSKDTEGCILVGTSNSKEGDDYIGSSREAMNALMHKLLEATTRDEEITVEVV